MQIVIALSIILNLLFQSAYAEATANEKTVYASSYQVNPAQKCIEAICGPPAQFNGFMKKYYARVVEYFSLKDTSFVFPEEVKKVVTELKEEEKKQNLAAIELLKKSEASERQYPEGVAKAFYNFTFASPFLGKAKYKVSKEGEKVIVAVDEPGTKAELKDLSEEDQSWMLRSMEYYLKIYRDTPSFISDSEIKSQPPSVILKRIYPSLSVKEAAMAELKSAEGALLHLKDLSPLEYSIFFENISPEMISKIASNVENGSADENEIRKVLLWNSNFKISESVFRDPKSPFLDRKTPTTEELIRKAGGMVAVIKNFEKELQDQEREIDNKLWSCHLQYFMNKGILPNSAQVENLKKDTVKARKMVIASIQSQFPSFMQAKLIKSVEDVDFIYPPSVSDYEKSFFENMKSKLDIAQQNTKSIQKMSQEQIRSFVPILQLAKANQKQNSATNSWDSNKLCGSFQYDPMSDGNYTALGSIVLSYTTAIGDDTSRFGTIQHELGHSVFREIAGDQTYLSKLSSLRKCLKDQHTEEFPEKMKDFVMKSEYFKTSFDGPYSSEDFADMLAGESSKSIQGKNLWCQVLNLSQDGQQYQESQMQANDLDVHSSNLFRLLHFEFIKKNGIPNSCEKFLKDVSFTKNFQPCIELANPKSSDEKKANSVK
jgi:hypothetical protein